MRILVLLALLTACGNGETETVGGHHGVDPEFAPYVQLFESLHGQSIGSMPIYFSDGLPLEWAGGCRGFSSGKPLEIEISRTLWDSNSDDVREAVMLHELGHCVLNRAHVDARVKCQGSGTDAPQSLMFPQVDASCYSLNKQPYWDELFSQR